MEPRESPRASSFQMPLHSHSSSPFSAAASPNYFHHFRASSRFPPHEQQHQQQHQHQHQHHEQYEQQQQQQQIQQQIIQQQNQQQSNRGNPHQNPLAQAQSHAQSQSQSQVPNPHSIQQLQLQHHPHAHHHPPHQMQLSANSMSSTSPPPVSSVQQQQQQDLSRCSSDPVMVVKRKRGRPRKYVTDANGAGGLITANMSPVTSASPREKKTGKSSSKRGQLASLGATGQGFTPHVLSIRAGEDLAEKITTFSQHGPWAVCVLSANGAISYASLWHSGITSGAVPYEGHLEILSLSGLFLLADNGQRTGGLSISLAGPDGRVFGGRVAGPLMAASPIQVIVGTFFSDNRKSQARAGNGDGAPCVASGGDVRHEGLSMEHMHLDASRTTMQEIEELTGAENEHNHHISHVMPLQSADWGANHYDLESRSRSEQMQ